MGLEFSFDAKKYRKNLTETLKVKRAENPVEAKELLEKERETLRYKVSKDIKKVLAKIEAKKQGKPETEIEKPKSKELSVETLKIEDSDGIEHELELHTIDISSQIPDEYKLLYDIYRLKTLEYELSHLEIGPNTHNEYLEKQKLTKDRGGFALSHTDMFELLEEYLLDRYAGEEDKAILSEFNYGSFDKKDPEVQDRIARTHGIHYIKTNEFMSQIILKTEDALYDSITDGAFSDKKVLTIL